MNTMFRPATVRYRGCAYTYPSTAYVNSLPNEAMLTRAGVNCVSLLFWPVRPLSYRQVVTFTAAAGSASMIAAATINKELDFRMVLVLLSPDTRGDRRHGRNMQSDAAPNTVTMASRTRKKLPGRALGWEVIRQPHGNVSPPQNGQACERGVAVM